MRTRNQEYAARIFEQVSQVPVEERDRYGSLAHGLPVLVRTAGLAQALAFVDARGGSGGKRLLEHLATVVLDDVGAAGGKGEAPSGAELLRLSRNADLPEYMLLTRNVLMALTWYKRFADSVLGVKAGMDREVGEE